MQTTTPIVLAMLWLLISNAPLAQATPEQSKSVAVASSEPSAPTDSPGKSFDCTELGHAHAALLSGCFSARRQFAATLNQKPVRREVVQLNYAAGELAIELIEEEVFDKRIGMGGEGDMVADSSFSCDRMTRNADGRYELESGEDPERIIFDYDRDKEVLLPVRWEFEEKARFLFKKFHIQAHADYNDVSFTACGTESDAGQAH